MAIIRVYFLDSTFKASADTIVNMEWLATRPAEQDFDVEKIIYLCPASTLEDLAEKISPNTANFALFIAMDATAIDDAEILRGAKTLLAKGQCLLSAWGPDCERVHDLFDVAARKINDELTGDDVIMTSWHENESLGEALFFFAQAVCVTKKFEETCKDWIVGPISNSEWEQLIRSSITQMLKS